jgi:hypothetical protein
MIRPQGVPCHVPAGSKDFVVNFVCLYMLYSLHRCLSRSDQLDIWDGVSSDTTQDSAGITRNDK